MGKIFFSIISNLIIELSATILVVSCRKRRAVTHLSLIFTSADTAKFCNHIIPAEIITLFAQRELWVVALLDLGFSCLAISRVNRLVLHLASLWVFTTSLFFQYATCD